MKKNYLLYFLLLALSTPIWVSCNDWTESEAKDYFEGPSEEYYAALRAYKKSDHPKAFGWFGNWTGEGASLVNSMARSKRNSLHHVLYHHFGRFTDHSTTYI